MAGSSTQDGDLLVRGTLRCDKLQVPAGSVGDNGIDSSNPITAPKLQHQHERLYQQPKGTAVVTAAETVIHWAFAAGTISDLSAGVIQACVGGATITIDVKKNGTTILSSSLVLDNTNIAYASEPAVFSSVTYAAGDVISITVTAATGGGTQGQGLFINLTVREDAQ